MGRARGRARPGGERGGRGVRVHGRQRHEQPLDRGENPLYLPQAKVYTRSCALGPAIVPVWEAGPGPFPVAVRVERAGAEVWAAETSTARLARTPADLISWLTRALDFPAGVVLLTGTGVVPDRDFTLRAGDVVTIDVAGVGTLRNPVTVVGTGG
ncbi:fumarylacetoacetate hydrolase family protein [Phytohabitans houttuyneae]|uniref:fumarylacetoacetate hydrolase family protein n=1 Tax=Phytohabitans houttuyneae TaxID=1076126 RepID=UPI00280B40D5|nr:fumarylacetoacetate hydrolase family protein [Phytohabitans houttuyneae]